MDDDEVLLVRASIRLLSATENGRATPIRGSYRPNHNFLGPENRHMTVGRIDLPDGTEVKPGESIDLTVIFQNQPHLEDQIYPGREWRIQEGAKLVGVGRVIEVLPNS